MRFLFFLISFIWAQELIFYCGITMSKPMSELAKMFEKEEKVKIKIIPGSSKGLLNTIKTSKEGDLYLPGSEGYILKNRVLFSKYEYVGYNQLVIVVKKGNPKNIKSLKDFFKKDIKIAMCNYKMSSCGKESKKILKDNFFTIYDKSIAIVLDSIPLNQIVSTFADTGLNWKATLKWANFNQLLEPIKIKEAKKHKLFLAIIRYSKNPKLAEKFLEFVKKNKNVLKRFGFED